MNDRNRLCLMVLTACCLVGVARAAIQMRVDVNFDGVVAFPDKRPPRTPVDLTTPEEPFLVWWNSDQDDVTYDETVPITDPDSGDEVINSLRDMEDPTYDHYEGGTCFSPF